MKSPVGYGLGVGMLLGAVVNLAGVVLNLIFYAIVLTSRTNSPIAGLGAVYGETSNLFHLFIAPFVGAMFGLVGGLIGAASLPKDI